MLFMDDIDFYLKEDLGEGGDITSDSLFTDETAKAKIIGKEEGIVAGLDQVEIVFKKTGATVKKLVKDGDQITKNIIVAEVEGPVRSILKGERLALNILSRMSGIATQTKKLVDVCKSINPSVTIAATRKTTPGFRTFEKKAVVIGGGEPHRYGLYDVLMIKDNHLKIIGSVEKAIKKAKEKITDKILEVEVESEEDALIAAKLDVDVLMLDNFKVKDAEMISKKIRGINPNIVIEISGGITPDNIKEYASFADRISLGYLTHSIKNKDFSLEII